MDYYCRKYRFGKPFISLQAGKGRNAGWEASMTVDGRRIGLGDAKSKKDATKNCYLDVVHYLEGCDPDLWKSYLKDKKTGKSMLDSIPVRLHISGRLEDDIKDLNHDMERSELFNNAPKSSTARSAPMHSSSSRQPRPPKAIEIEAKSAALMRRRKAYLEDPAMAKMRESRATLPVYSRADEVLKHLEVNEITIVMARGNLEVSSTALVDTWRLRVGADPILEASDGWSLACMSVRNKGFQLLHRRSTKESMRCE